VAVEITFSEMDSFAVCPWQWQKKYVELKRAKRKSVKLSFGAAIHKGIEAFYLRQGNPLEVVRAYCNEVRRKAESDGVPIDTEYDLILKKAETVITAYTTRWTDDFNHWNIITVEPSFSIPLTIHNGEPISIAGKIDRIVTEKRTGFLHPVETKTVASWDPDVNRLMLDFQVSVYSWAMSKMLHLQDVTFIYDILKKPMQRLKKNETETEYLERVKQEISEDLDVYFIRDKITRSRKEIERTEKELIIRCKELVDRRRDGLVYRTPGDHCHWRCDFMPPCLEDSDEMWDALYYTETNVHPELATQEEERRAT
jgi:ATP-dependent helicase/DNAse subunit B